MIPGETQGFLLYLITRLNILFYNEEGGVSFVTKHVLERDTKRPATDSCCLTSSFRGRWHVPYGKMASGHCNVQKLASHQIPCHKRFFMQDWVSRLWAHYYKIFYLFVGLIFFLFCNRWSLNLFCNNSNRKRMRFPLKIRGETIGKTCRTKV